MSSTGKGLDEHKEVFMDAESAERTSSGRAAGPSGRSHSVQQEGESWDQEEFAKFDRKKPSSVMVEFPAGSNVWYNGVPQKWTSKEVLFRIGVESREEAPCVWIKLTSSRIWRGSNAGNTWTYSGRGSWKPKGGRTGKKEKAAKGKAKSRKRKLHEDNQGSEAHQDDVTCTTKATMQPDSDEENVIEQCPSPLPFNGSNAVSPDGEGSKPSFERQHQEQENANILKILADKLVCKEEGKSAKLSALDGAVDLKFSRWLYRHYCLLEKQGQLNLAPEGCNPEAGRPIGSMLATSNHEGRQRSKETSSSSGSARQRQEASHNSLTKTTKDHQCIQDMERKGQGSLKIGKSRSRPSSFEAPRSPSPSTPSKPADGSRRQRSSSADLDPRSLTSGPCLNDKDIKGGEKGPDQPMEHSSEPRLGTAGVTVKAHLPQGSLQHTQGQLARSLSAGTDIISRAKDLNTRKRCGVDASSIQAPCGGGKAGQQISSPQDVGQLIHAKSLGKHGDEAQQPRLSLPQNAKAGNMVPRLVETDPFSKNDVIRCKAC